MSNQRRAVVVVNPSSGHGAGHRRMPLIRSSLARHFGSDFEIQFSQSAEHLRRLAQAAVDARAEVFVVCGGDGSAHFALQPLLHSETALGLIPIGSGNDLAINLGVPVGIEQAVKTIARGRARRIDIAQTRTGLYACIAGVGLDSEVNRRANVRNRWIRGRVLYPFAIFRTLASFRPRHVRIRCDDQVFEGPIMFAVVANAPSYGRGIKIAPMASLDDGALEVCIIKATSKPYLLWHYPKTYHGTHVGLPFFLRFQGTDVEIQSDQPLELFGDGEYMETTPTRIQLLPRALKVIVPQ